MATPQITFTKLFISNQFIDYISGKTFPTINPATEEVICQVSEGDKSYVNAAVKAAGAASLLGSTWRTMDASKRGQMLNKMVDLMERDYEYLSALETLDNGKPVTASKGDLDHSITIWRYFSGWADKIHGDTIPVDGPYMSLIRKEPVKMLLIS